MQSALERRQEILEVLSDRRRDTVDNKKRLRSSG